MKSKATQELENFITLAQASKELGLTYGQVDYYLGKLGINAPKVGNTRLIHRKDLKRLEEKCNAPKLV